MRISSQKSVPDEKEGCRYFIFKAIIAHRNFFGCFASGDPKDIANIPAVQKYASEIEAIILKEVSRNVYLMFIDDMDAAEAAEVAELFENSQDKNNLSAM